ncbi:sensor histidine kinase [Arenimonas donghaensis]|uniref:histidine kinase n=1 Tax=Arenimonas donghaensis DSM 18148 = HO3-R19 TaxID=1121014 RepID=A0A087MM18_9GAMM|nr:HAMP domain-containing sensor histidine kinase [Arenimonas donghaensis]KFL37921.1 hypothetical protein N788_01750 [Arenimonas donghaensis DSM 18148 = HO3-R19]
MNARASLRWRVALAYAAMGFLMSLGFAVATLFIAEDYEHILIGAILQSQGEHYQERLQTHPGLSLPVSQGFSAYREADAPEAFRALAPGIHEPRVSGRDGVHVGVFGQPGHRLVFVVDLGAIEALERYLVQIMLAVVLLGSLASGWLGWLMAGRAVSPVRRLAHVVETLPVRPVATRLASEFSRDEVGRLAAAIDGYQARLSEAESAEQAFHANASHELRTPITVVRGAVEVMRDDPGLPAPQGRRLDRIDRAIDELSLLVEALLLGGRAMPVETDAVLLPTVVSEALSRLARLNPDGQALVHVRGLHPLQVHAPKRWVECVVNVLLQRALSRMPGVAWDLDITPGGLVLAEQGHGPDGDGKVERSDRGLGLMFVERLCRELDWRLVQGQDAQGRLRVALEMVR